MDKIRGKRRSRWLSLWRRGERGSALVELALTVPMLGVLLVGASEFAILEYDSIEVNNAARAGVAYGSQSSSTAADIAGMESAATNDGENVAGIQATAFEFYSCSSTPSAQKSAPPSCTTGDHVLNYVQVNTTATVNPTIAVPGLPATYTLSGVAVMRVQ
ncbi:MAG TPA: TadE/TadG family type IV pilus assembly protein [Candidatus Methylacidiphilales bacterium]|nr:TadE/TadG family type IV pilus assembly protein [Candidatus Methylacidiphilales bacterium]